MARTYTVALAALMMSPGAATAQDTVTYYHTDAIGSVRMITDANGGTLYRYDYLAFGVSCPAPQCASQQPDTRQFAGKDRDVDTAFDYFGARYYDSVSGRFASVDPLGSSASTANPQTFNRYSYAMNNPLRFVDPEGLEVSHSCAVDPKCEIVVSVNVIWDSSSRTLSAAERTRIERNHLDKARKMYKTSNITLQFSYIEGTVTRQGDTYNSSGVRSDSINVAITDQIQRGYAGKREDGAYLTFVPVNSWDINVFPAVVNTTAHELAHHFLGHSEQPRRTLQEYYQKELSVNSRLSFQYFGIGQTDMRTGIEPRAYAVPQTQGAPAPKQ